MQREEMPVASCRSHMGLPHCHRRDQSGSTKMEVVFWAIRIREGSTVLMNMRASAPRTRAVRGERATPPLRAAATDVSVIRLTTRSFGLTILQRAEHRLRAEQQQQAAVRLAHAAKRMISKVLDRGDTTGGALWEAEQEAAGDVLWRRLCGLVMSERDLHAIPCLPKQPSRACPGQVC